METQTEKPTEEGQIAVLRSGDLLGVGASVTWCHSSSNGRSIGFTTRRGKIIDRTEERACVKYRGKLIWLPLHRFRSASASSELTEFVAGPESAPNIRSLP